MTDNSLPIADKKPLQKRYYATIDIYTILILRILEIRFTNRILHKNRSPTFESGFFVVCGAERWSGHCCRRAPGMRPRERTSEDPSRKLPCAPAARLSRATTAAAATAAQGSRGRRNHPYPRLSMLSTEGLVIMTSCSSCSREGDSPLAEGTMRQQGLLSSSGAVCVTVGTRIDSPWRASWRARSSADAVMTMLCVMISIMAIRF